MVTLPDVPRSVLAQQVTCSTPNLFFFYQYKLFSFFNMFYLPVSRASKCFSFMQTSTKDISTAAAVTRLRTKPSIAITPIAARQQINHKF